jgi:hypothetical protein
MKITIVTGVPEGFEATNDLKIFSPLDDPSVCVMCQRYRLSSTLQPNPNGDTVWIPVPTERVEKIRFADPKEFESKIIKLKRL